MRNVVVANERKVRNRADRFVDGLDTHAGHTQVFYRACHLDSRELGFDADTAYISGHPVETPLEGCQIGVGHPENRVSRLHDVGILDGFRELRAQEIIGHVGVEHSGHREITPRRGLGILDAVDSCTAFAAVHGIVESRLTAHGGYHMGRVATPQGFLGLTASLLRVEFLPTGTFGNLAQLPVGTRTFAFTQACVTLGSPDFRHLPEGIYLQGRFLTGLLHTLTVHGLVCIEAFVQSRLLFVGEYGRCDRGIRRPHDRTDGSGGCGSRRIQVQRHRGSTPDVAQKRENLLQAYTGRVGLDVYLTPFLQMSEGRVDLADGAGDRPLGVHDALDCQGGIPFRLGLLLVQLFLADQFIGLVTERAAVDFLAGVDGQLDTLRQLFDFGQQGLDTLQSFLRFSGLDFQIEVEILLLAVLSPEGLFHGLHHLVDVGDDRCKARPALA